MGQRRDSTHHTTLSQLQCKVLRDQLATRRGTTTQVHMQQQQTDNADDWTSQPLQPAVCRCSAANNLGCLEHALHMLEAPHAFAHSTGEHAATPPPPLPPPLSLRLPDTLVFSERGADWFRSDSRGLLTRQPHASVHLESVLAAFAPGVFDMQQPAVTPGLEHVAIALRPHAPTISPLHPDSTQIQAQFVYSATCPLAEGVSRVVYLTAIELLRLLTEVNEDWRRPRVYGTLQRFLQPGGWTPPHASQRATQRRNEKLQHQRVYRIAWSPHYTSIEVRTNMQRFTPPPRADPASVPADAAGVLSKLVTFDGPPSCSTLSRVTQPLKRRKFDDLCRTLIERLQLALPRRRIKWMELFVKSEPSVADSRTENIVLLYVRSLRVMQIDELASAAAGSHSIVPSTLCVQCGLPVDPRSADSANLSTQRQPAAKSRGGASTGHSRRTSKMFSFDAVGEGSGEPEQGDEVDSCSVAVFHSDGTVATELYASREQRLEVANSVAPLVPAPARPRPRSAAPMHLRNHPTSNQSTLTPFELAAALQFDLMASLPAETEATGARRGEEIVQTSLRPRLVADVFAASPNRRQRGVSLVDPVVSASASAASSSGATVVPRSVQTYRDDVMGLYTRDIAASRRKQLQVALRASLPQNASTSFRRTAPPPSISTCHRFLNPPATTTHKQRVQPPPPLPEEPRVPTLADLLGGDLMAPSHTQSHSHSHSARPAAPSKRQPPNPLSVWRDNFHAPWRRQQAQLHAANGSSRATTPGMHNRATTAPRSHSGSASARPSTSHSAAGAAAAHHRYPGAPRHFGAVVPVHPSRPQTAQTILGRFDPDAEYFLPEPEDG